MDEAMDQNLLYMLTRLIHVFRRRGWNILPLRAMRRQWLMGRAFELTERTLIRQLFVTYVLLGRT